MHAVKFKSAALNIFRISKILGTIIYYTLHTYYFEREMITIITKSYYYYIVTCSELTD
jgi:hypothetical protein